MIFQLFFHLLNFITQFFFFERGYDKRCISHTLNGRTLTAMIIYIYRVHARIG